jgi:hypothetical protein
MWMSCRPFGAFPAPDPLTWWPYPTRGVRLGILIVGTCLRKFGQGGAGQIFLLETFSACMTRVHSRQAQWSHYELQSGRSPPALIRGRPRRLHTSGALGRLCKQRPNPCSAASYGVFSFRRTLCRTRYNSRLLHLSTIKMMIIASRLRLDKREHELRYRTSRTLLPSVSGRGYFSRLARQGHRIPRTISRVTGVPSPASAVALGRGGMEPGRIFTPLSRHCLGLSDSRKPGKLPKKSIPDLAMNQSSSKGYQSWDAGAE